MKKFYCPFCNEPLSHLGDAVIRMKGRIPSSVVEVVTTFYLSADLGKYDALIEGDVTIKEGAKVDFLCTHPKCGRSFTANWDNDLAEIKMVDEENIEYVVVFNRIFGKQATFLVNYAMKELQSSFGDHKDEYEDDFSKDRNFFGA